MAMSQHGAAVKHGWRSGLEKRVGAELEAAGVDYEFETLKVRWVSEPKEHTYTPDFIITTRTGKTIVIETKGRWMRADRLKLQQVVKQNPDLDLRIVFQNPNAKIAKGSKTSYAAWCDKHLGIPWAKGSVPEEWLNE